VEALHRLYPDIARVTLMKPGDRLIVSEPVADLPGAWEEIPPGSAVVAHRGGELEHHLFQPVRSALAASS